MFAPRLDSLDNNLYFFFQNRNKIRIKCLFVQLYKKKWTFRFIHFFGFVIEKLSTMTNQNSLLFLDMERQHFIQVES